MKQIKGVTLTHASQKMLEKQNDETVTHCLRVAQIATIFADDLNLPKELMYDCGLWHDAGKMYIIDIISKTDGLTTEEFEIIKTHPVKGVEYIENNYDGNHYFYVKMATLMHHCRINEGGYPTFGGLHEIPLFVQMISIADCFEALTAKRCYKEPFSAEKSKQMILNGECGQFSNKALELFIKNYDKILLTIY